MAGPTETIRSYLVRLGWAPEAGSWQKFDDELKRTGVRVEKYAAAMAKDFTIAGGVATTMLATVAGATLGIMKSVSDQDLRYQVLARRMFMTTEATKKMKMATDALGYSLEEIIWGPPELAERYRALIHDQDRMFRFLGSDGGERAFRTFRNLEFQGTRMTVALQTFGMVLTTDIIKKLTGTGSMEEALKVVTGWVDRFELSIPKISDVISNTLVPAIKTAATATMAFFADVQQFFGWLESKRKVSSIVGQNPASEVGDYIVGGEFKTDEQKKQMWGGLWAAYGPSESWSDVISEDAAKLGIPRGLALAIAQQESDMNPKAPPGSHGEIGMFQLMPDTIQKLLAQHKIGDPTNPEQNIWGGLNWLRDKPGATWAEKIKAYNGTGHKADVYQEQVLEKWRANNMMGKYGSSGDYAPGATVQPQSYKIEIHVDSDPTKLKEDIKRAVVKGIEYHEHQKAQRQFAYRQGVS